MSIQDKLQALREEYKKATLSDRKVIVYRAKLLAYALEKRPAPAEITEADVKRAMF